MSQLDKQGGMSVEGANIQQQLALEIRKYQTVRGEQPAGTNERLLSDALAALRSASSSCAARDAALEEAAPLSSTRDIHAAAMYDLARECGWSEVQSKPPVEFIRDRLKNWL